jgi:predicted nucleic-acid-binding Zn-ribbon protein
MKRTNTCPKCTGEELYVLEPWQQPDPDSSNRTNPVQVAFRLDVVTRDAPTDVELWICAACGYSELYAAAPQHLARFADAGVDGVRRVVRKNDGGAYR